MGDVMVLEFLALLEGAYQDGVVLRRDKRDCVETEWWRHVKRVAGYKSSTNILCSYNNL